MSRTEQLICQMMSLDKLSKQTPGKSTIVITRHDFYVACKLHYTLCVICVIIASSAGATRLSILSNFDSLRGAYQISKSRQKIRGRVKQVQERHLIKSR